MSKEFIEFEQSLIDLKTDLMNNPQTRKELRIAWIAFKALGVLTSTISIFILTGFTIIPIWIFFTVKNGFSPFYSLSCLCIHFIVYQFSIRRMHVEEIQVVNSYCGEISAICREQLKKCRFAKKNKS
jgi:hypothetical protein